MTQATKSYSKFPEVPLGVIPSAAIVGGMETRSYSLLTITKADEDTREISGVMSTPETDRVGDQVLSLGVKAKLPAPCLWQHDHGDPIGEIVWIDPKPDGIRFRAKLAKVAGPPSLKEKLDGYFALIKEGLVKGISIGFRPLEMEPIKTGWLIRTWELLEASVVTIPANASCTIQTVKAVAAKSSGPRRSTAITVECRRPKTLPVVKLNPIARARISGTLKIHTRKPGDPIRIIRTTPRPVKLDPELCTWLNQPKEPARVVRLTQKDHERAKVRVVKLGRR